MNRSQQRDLILDYLKSTKSHPTAEEIYQVVKTKNSRISLGTVYRNLNLLSDNKMILRLHMEDGIDHFDADISEHYHFYCKNCGRVYDLDINLKQTSKNMIKKALPVVHGTIEGCSIYFTGRCDYC